MKNQIISLRERYTQPYMNYTEFQAENDRPQQQVIDLNAQVTEKQTEIRRLRDKLFIALEKIFDQQFIINRHVTIRE